MRHYRNLRALLVLLTITCCLSGCAPVFLNPISEPDRAELDKRLLGRWKGTDKENKNDYILFEASSNTQMNVSLFDDKEPNPKPMFRMFSSKVGSRYYMNLGFIDEDTSKGYLLARYELEGTTLTVWLLDEDKVKAAIERGLLKGNPGVGTIDTKVNDSSERVVQFLAASDSWFTEKMRFEKQKT
jgi:hypothetical protein